MRIKIGVLGKANIALRSIIPTLAELSDQFEIVAIATRSKADGESDINGIPVIEGYDQLLDIDTLDAVYIPLPIGMHYEWIRKALNKGLHVWVEKSLASTESEVKELISLAKEKQLVVLESFQFRFHKQLKSIQESLKGGIIGEVRSFRASFGFPPFPDADNIRYQKSLGGGALLDAGAYTLKTAALFLGKDVEVVAAQLAMDEDRQVDIYGNGMLKTKDGAATAQVSFGFDNFYQCGIEVWGSKGKLFTNRLFTARKGFVPQMTIETNEGSKTVDLPEDDAFTNIALHFHKMLKDKDSDLRNEEYEQNLLQAKLIESFKQKSI